jgi:hypothetical protein
MLILHHIEEDKMRFAFRKGYGFEILRLEAILLTKVLLAVKILIMTKVVLYFFIVLYNGAKV